MQAKNKNGEVLFDSRESSLGPLKKVMEGIADVKYFKSDFVSPGSEFSGEYLPSNPDDTSVTLFNGATVENAIVFAKPYAENVRTPEVDDIDGDRRTWSNSFGGNRFASRGDAERFKFSKLLKGFWPVAIEFHKAGDEKSTYQTGQQWTSDGFTFVGPDATEGYYDGIRQSTNSPALDSVRALHTSEQHWKEYENVSYDQEGTPSFRTYAPFRMQYEVYVPAEQATGSIGGTFVDPSDQGLSVQDSAGREIFNSNQEAFNIEQVGYNRTSFNSGLLAIEWRGVFYGYATVDSAQAPYVDADDIIPTRHYLKQTSNAAQMEYMACMNGTASTVAIAIGGGRVNEDDGYQIPGQDHVAYWKSFVEFHYADENDITGAKPYIAQVGRLEKTRQYSSDGYGEFPNKLPAIIAERDQYLDYVRYNDELGVPTISIIGKTR